MTVFSAPNVLAGVQEDGKGRETWWWCCFGDGRKLGKDGGKKEGRWGVVVVNSSERGKGKAGTTCIPQTARPSRQPASKRALST